MCHLLRSSSRSPRCPADDGPDAYRCTPPARGRTDRLRLRVAGAAQRGARTAATYRTPVRGAERTGGPYADASGSLRRRRTSLPCKRARNRHPPKNGPPDPHPQGRSPAEPGIHTPLTPVRPPYAAHAPSTAPRSAPVHRSRSARERTHPPTARSDRLRPRLPRCGTTAVPIRRVRPCGQRALPTAERPLPARTARPAAARVSAPGRPAPGRQDPGSGMPGTPPPDSGGAARRAGGPGAAGLLRERSSARARGRRSWRCRRGRRRDPAGGAAVREAARPGGPRRPAEGAAGRRRGRRPESR